MVGFADVAGPEVDDPNEGQALLESEHAEIGVVGYDDTTFNSSRCQNHGVGCAEQSGLFDIDDLKTFGSKERDDVGVNVLVCEYRKLAQFHATPAVK